MAVLRIHCLTLLTILLCGCPGPSSEAPTATPEAAPPAQPEPAAATEPEADPEPPRQNALQREAKFVDRKAFLEKHPNATEIEKNVISANNPISAVAQGYFAAVSSLTISAYQHDLQLWYQLNNERWPTFAEYEEILSKHDIKLKGLKPRQVYAYDDTNGQLSILEAPEGESID